MLKKRISSKKCIQEKKAILNEYKEKRSTNNSDHA